MCPLALQFLGGFRAHLASGSPLPLTARKAQALLAYLAARPGQPHSRDKLATLLWPDVGDEQARQNLRVSLVGLRRALPSARPPILVAEGDSLALTASAVDVDIVVFEHLVAEGGAEALGKATRLYTGEFLEGFRVTEPPYEDWLRAERARLHQLAFDALAKLVQLQQAAGASEAAVHTALRLLELDSLYEPVHRVLMRLYVQQGRRGEALKQYQACVTALRRELGADPEAETRRLYQDIVRRATDTPSSAGARGENSRPQPFTSTPASLDLPLGETGLFGREAELGRLRALLDEAVKGEGHLAVVTGEAGIGKTRLLGALASDALERGCGVLIGRCHESDSILPFGPWVDALRSSGASTDSDLLSRLSPASRSELRRLLPEMAHPDLPLASNSDLRLFEAVAQMVEDLATPEPLVLMLEDLHWADEMSLRLLVFLARRIGSRSVIVVATAREEELLDAAMARRTVRELARIPSTVTLALSPLPRSETFGLVHALMRAHGDAGTARSIEERIWTMSEGNPFVIVETTRAIQDGAVLPDSRTIALPQRVRDLIASRLERLSERASDVATIASVIGREFDFALLHRAAGLEETVTAEAVEELVRRSILRGVGERFEFTHERMRAVVYGELLGPHRKLRHRRVAEAMEALHRDDLGPHQLRLGMHCVEGEQWDRAVHHLHQAAIEARRRSAYREAASACEQALAALAHLPASMAVMADAVDVRLEFCRALDVQAQWQRSNAVAQDAEARASALGDPQRMAEVLNRRCIYLRILGEHREAIRVGERALAIATTLGDSELQALARCRVSQACLAIGDLRRAAELLGRVVDGPTEDATRQLITALARIWLALTLAGLGEFDEAERQGENAFRFIETAGNPWALINVHVGLALVMSARGGAAQAIELAERGLALSRTWHIVDWLFGLNGALSTAMRLAGRVGEAVLFGERAVEDSPVGHRAVSLLRLGDAYLSAGRAADAARCADEALRIAGEQGDDRNEAGAVRLLGDIAARSDPPDVATAEGNYRRALAMADPLGLRPFVAHCHAALGALYARTGRRNMGREHQSTASAMYREMGMWFWLDKAERG